MFGGAAEPDPRMGEKRGGQKCTGGEREEVRGRHKGRKRRVAR